MQGRKLRLGGGRRAYEVGWEAGRRAEGAASREQGAGRGRRGGGEAQAAEPPGWRSAVAGRVRSPFPSSLWSPHPGGGGHFRRPGWSPAAVSRRVGSGPELRGAPSTGRALRGAEIGCGEAAAEGRWRMRGPYPRSPCPNRFPLSGWVSVSKLLPFAKSLPSQHSSFLSTFVFWSQSCLGICRCPPPQFLLLPTRSVCVCERETEVGLGLRLASLAAPNLKDLLAFSVALLSFTGVFCLMLSTCN